MIVPMKVITLLCMEQDKENALSRLGGLALMQLSPSAAPATEDVSKLAARVSALEKICGFVMSAPAVKNASAVQIPQGRTVAQYVQEQIDTIAATSKQLEQLGREYDALAPWGEFDPSLLADLRKRGVHVTLCATQTALFDRRMKSAAFPQEATLHQIKRTKDYVYYALIDTKPIENGEFDPVELPSKSLGEVTALLDSCKSAVADANHRISLCKQYLPELQKELADLRGQYEFVAARDGMSVDGQLVYLTGYVPETMLDTLRSAADANGWALLIEDPADDDENVPTYIEKAKFLKVLDPLFDFIGISPGYRESDVYLFFFFFFPVFFGMIIGDAGYGFLSLAVCVIARILLRNCKPAHLPISLFFFLSVFSVIWGWLNGTWFGIEAELPGWMSGWNFFTDPQNSPFARKMLTFYKQDIGAPDFDWSGIPNKMTQYFCFFLALVHLSSAHITRFVTGIRHGWREISNLGWTGMIVANFVLAVSLIVFPGSFPRWCIGLYIVSVLLIVVTLKPSQYLSLPNDLVGSFVDVLSYIRLFAVGLSGMYIAQKFNMMGMMLMNALPDKLVVLGFILLVFVVLAGHLLNIALGCLSVLVHAIRLNTLEFSNHMGIQWAGIKFKPFSASKQNNN